MSNKTISDQDTPDPWLIAANNQFYLTFTSGDRIEIWSSPHLEDFHDCAKSTIWKPTPGRVPLTEEIWAPELHWLNNKWYIYASAGKGAQHRTIYLRSDSKDPMVVNEWKFCGRLMGMPEHWAIDATIMVLPDLKSTGAHQTTLEAGEGMGSKLRSGIETLLGKKTSSPGEDESAMAGYHAHTPRLYIIWSGWPEGDFSDTKQNLYIAELISPEAAKPGSAVCISTPDLPWEKVADNGERGVNEGPSFVNFAGFRGIVYSAGGSWTSEYKLGLLALVDPTNPLKPESWKKRSSPLLVSDKEHGGPFGPGHASFVHSAVSSNRVMCIYHGTEHHGEGWSNRKARVVSLEAGCFEDQAPPVCCAYKKAYCGGEKSEL